jgi:TPP-dependent pyruvate/acetoin dehydrogenase alpha subunit
MIEPRVPDGALDLCGDAASMGRFGLTETPHENPLVPNKKLRQIYTTMLEARLLDEHIVKLQRKAKARQRLYSTFGQEACRVATAIELNSGDLVSDIQVGATMDLLFGAKPARLLRHIAAVASGTRERSTLPTQKDLATRQLSWVDDPVDRLMLALGAALTLKTLKQANIIVAYVHYAELPKRQWKQILALAAKLNLPIIFVIVPERDSADHQASNICAKARSAGIPGIPVDVNDAVALYRVAQESMGRARAGDGPVLIECVARGDAGGKTDDPILHMKKFMIGRRVCNEDWANHAADVFRKRLQQRTAR